MEDVCCILFLWSYFQAVSAVFRLTIKILIAGRIIFHKFLLSVFPFSFVELFGKDRESESESESKRESGGGEFEQLH